MMRLDKRVAALKKTADKYQDKTFLWGKADCLTMLRSHLVAMGHKNLPKLPRYKDALSAKRALKASGHDNLESLLDEILPRIAPASMLAGDVGLMRGDGPLDAITICVGKKQLGWFEGYEEPVMIVPDSIKAAWRV